MKRLLTILILILTFQTPSQADDIRDFQIEGMSIGDSLFDYFSKGEFEQAKKKSKIFKQKDGKFNELLFFKLSKFKVYDGVKVTWEPKDQDYKLIDLKRIIFRYFDPIAHIIIDKDYARSHEHFCQALSPL